MERIRSVGRKKPSVDSTEACCRALDAIVSETGCTPKEAESTLAWIRGFVIEAREDEYGVLHPTTEEMAGREYELFDLVVPHDGTAKPGSAHKAIEEALLDPRKDEFALSHCQVVRGGREYCQVEVCVNTP